MIARLIIDNTRRRVTLIHPCGGWSFTLHEMRKKFKRLNTERRIKQAYIGMGYRVVSIEKSGSGRVTTLEKSVRIIDGAAQ